MPIPRSVARFNRVAINPLLRRVSTHAPYFATLIHRGRRSGLEHQTPLNVFPVADGFIIALTYGQNADWRKNLFAAEHARMVHRGVELRVVAPRFLPEDEALTALPLGLAQLLALLNVHDFIEVDVGEDT